MAPPRVTAAWPPPRGHQAYLVDCNGRLEADLERARREGFHLGAKLVRGAYLNHERERASRMGYADPTQPGAEATHRSYDRAVETLLRRAPLPEKVPAAWPPC